MMDIVIPLLYGAYELDPENLDTNYNLAYVLNVIGEGDLALEYLRKLKVTNDSIEELIDVIIGGETNEQ